MSDAKIVAGVALKFLGKLTYPEKCPVRLALPYRFLGTVPCQNFSACCDDQWWTTLLVSANHEHAAASV
jgi:hypothetical protein